MKPIIRILLLSMLLSTSFWGHSLELQINVSSDNPISEVLSQNEIEQVDSLKISGGLSKADFQLLLKMTNYYKLRHIDLYNTTNGTIFENAFENCPLQSIILPSNCKYISSLAFAYCGNLEYIDLGNSLEYIGHDALRSCPKLKTIVFPKTLRTLSGQCFIYTPFTDVYCKGTTPIHISAGNFTCYDTCTLHVPLNSKSAYELTQGWMKFHKIVEESYETTYTASSLCTGKGKVFVNGKEISNSYLKFPEGETVTVKIVPDKGYQIEQLLVNGIDYAGKYDDNEFSIKMVMDLNINVSFIKETKRLTIKDSNSGTITFDLEKGKSYNFTVAPNNGWEVEGIFFNGDKLYGNQNQFATPVIDSDSELIIVYHALENSIAETFVNSDISISCDSGTVHINNNGQIAQCHIYNINGGRVLSKQITAGETSISLPTDNTYIISINNTAYKIRL